VWWSDNGTTWIQATAHAAFPPRSGHISVVYHNKMWVIGGASSIINNILTDVWWSDNGTTWTEANSNSGISGYLGIVFNNDIWTFGNDAWWSNNGITW